MRRRLRRRPVPHLPARRRVARRAAAGRARRRPTGQRRGGERRGGRDPRAGARTARLRSRRDELRGTAPWRWRSRRPPARSSIRRARAAPASPTRRSARARRRSARSATGPSSSSSGGRPAYNPRLLERLRPRALVELDGDFEALWELRARVTGAPLRDPTPELDDLARRLLDARHVAFIHGALDELEALALFELVRDLNRDRHAVTLAVRSEGNARGAEDVLAWQTGFPDAVSFARGYPRANPGEFSAAALLERGEVDAALVVTADAAGTARTAAGRGRHPRHRHPGGGARRVRRRRDRRAPSTGWTACRFRSSPLDAGGLGVQDVLAAIEGRL